MKYSEFLQNLTDLQKVEQDGRAIKYVKKQTPELCKIAVEQDGRVFIMLINLFLIKNRT